MCIVVSYDITCDRRRRKVAKLLSGYGRRQQYSVFECDISEKRYREMVTGLTAIIDGDEDSVRIYRQCAMCRGAIEILGQGEPFKEQLYQVI